MVISPCFSFPLPRSSESQKPEIRGQTSEIRNQKSEVRILRKESLGLTSVFSLLLIVFKGDTNAYLCIFEKILSIHPDNFAGFNTCKLSFFLRQSLCSREIQLYKMTRPDRSRHRQCNENACFADITASAYNEPVGLRYPDTNGPGDAAAVIFSLFN